MAHFGEGAIAVVVKQEAGCPLEHSWNAVEVLSELVVAARKMLILPVIDKAAGKQIEPSVVIEVEKRAAWTQCFGQITHRRHRIVVDPSDATLLRRNLLEEERFGPCASA